MSLGPEGEPFHYHACQLEVAVLLVGTGKEDQAVETVPEGVLVVGVAFLAGEDLAQFRAQGEQAGEKGVAHRGITQPAYRKLESSK